MIDFSAFSDEDILEHILYLGEPEFGMPIEPRSGSFFETQRIRLASSKIDDQQLRIEYIEPMLMYRLGFGQKLKRTEIEKRRSSFALIEYEKDVDLSIREPIRIAYIFVDAAEQGKGLARKLVDEIKNKFLSYCIRIECVDSQTNKRSDFFKKLGFSIVAQEEDTFVMEYDPNNNL